MTDKDAEIAALKAEVARLKPWSIALQDLTPGGSEFQTPDACLAYARGVCDRQLETIKKFVREKRTAEARVAKLEAGLRPFAEIVAPVPDYAPGANRFETSVRLHDVLHARALLNQDKTNG